MLAVLMRLSNYARPQGVLCTLLHCLISTCRAGSFWSFDMDVQDIVGQTFERLTVRRYAGIRESKGGCKRHSYECLCSCGAVKYVDRDNLFRAARGYGGTRSCGCLQRERMSAASWQGHGDISRSYWTELQAQAKERGKSFRLTIQDAWRLFQKQKGRCALSGLPLRFVRCRHDRLTATASLDRIDNSKGYVIDNVQWVHKDINWMRNRFSISRFIELCRAVTANQMEVLC